MVRWRHFARAILLVDSESIRCYTYYVPRTICAKRSRRLVSLLLLSFALFVYAPSKGQADEFASKFEVESVKPNRTGDANMGAAAQPGGRFIARNVPVQFLIQAAYDLKGFQIAPGSFSWISTDRFDITAKGPEGTPNGFEPLKPMLRSLLASRFKLAVHFETRESPIFELVAAKGGLKLSAPKDTTCVAPDPKNPQPRERRPLCDNIRAAKGLVEAHGIVMPRLAAVLSDVLGRPVVDKTGFIGTFDARLEFAPDETPVDPGSGDRVPATDLQKPSIVTVLQEQLGVKAQASKGPVQVMVIDSVERPTEN